MHKQEPPSRGLKPSRFSLNLLRSGFGHKVTRIREAKDSPLEEPAPELSVPNAYIMTCGPSGVEAG